MKTIIKTVALSFAALVAAAFCSPAYPQKPQADSVVVSAVMHCNSCVQKVEKNIPFEKGVKDIRIDFKNQKVTVWYDPRKTDPNQILKAFGNAKVEAKLAEPEKRSGSGR